MELPVLTSGLSTIELTLKRSPAERRWNSVNVAPPQADLGMLDATFPLELLHFILPQMDIRTLTALTCVNRRAAHLVRSLRIYRFVLAHGRDAWQEMLRSRSGLGVTLANLHDALCRSACDGCGHFGNYLYLLTCKRVCYACMTEKDAYRPVPYGLACRVYGLDGRPDLMRALPRMRYYLAPHLESGPWAAGPHVLVDSDAAGRAGRAVHGSDKARDQYVAQRRARESTVHPGNHLVAPRGYFSTYEPLPWTVEPVAEHETKSYNPYRWAALICVPYFNRDRNEEEWGFRCRACPLGRDESPLGARVYTLAMFEQHLEELGPIVDDQHQPA